MPTPQDAASVVEKWSSNITDYALLLAAIATLVMALLELAKAITSARTKFHRKEVRKWIKTDLAHRQLLVLSVSSVDTDEALFDQPTDKMMGQIQAAANTAMEFPSVYRDLYDFLTELPTSVAAQGDATASAEPSDADRWRDFVQQVEKGQSDERSAATVTAATRARARLDHFVSRKLDAFQTRTEYVWARWNQYVSVIGATIFLLFLLEDLAVRNTALYLLSSIFGGLIAPLAKDVVTALGGLRAKRA